MPPSDDDHSYCIAFLVCLYQVPIAHIPVWISRWKCELWPSRCVRPMTHGTCNIAWVFGP
eukprot:10146180-Alexandrium_andersonii.AAC.1